MATPSDIPIREQQENLAQESVIKIGRLLVHIVNEQREQILEGQEEKFVEILQQKTNDIGIFVPRLSNLDIEYVVKSVEYGSLRAEIDVILPKNKFIRYMVVSLAVGYNTMVLYPQFRAGVEMFYADVYNIVAIAAREFTEMNDLIVDDY